MADDLYKDALEAAQQELATLQMQRAEIDDRIARLRETVASLAHLIGDEAAGETYEVAGIGITDAVSKVLKVSGIAMNPAQIRDELARMGYDINKYGEIIPNITKVLQRLHAKGQVDVITSSTSDRKYYIWSHTQPANITRADYLRRVIETLGESVPIDAFSGKGSMPVKKEKK